MCTVSSKPHSDHVRQGVLIIPILDEEAKARGQVTQPRSWHCQDMNQVYLTLEPHVRTLTLDNWQESHAGRPTDQTSCMKTSAPPLPSRLSPFQGYLSSHPSTPQRGDRVAGSEKADSDICTLLWTGSSVNTARVQEKAPSNDPQMPVSAEADSSFLQARLHWPTHLTATPPLPNSSQA